MKLASRIFNILVFLVAVGAAICAYMLFNKREQITKGNQMMSTAVVKTVKTIDPAIKIKADEMSVKHPAEALKAPLATLEKTAKKIVDQRDNIAATLAAATNEVLSMDADLGKTAEQADSKNITAYKSSAEKCKEASDLVTDRIEYLRDRNVKLKDGLRSVISAAKAAEISDDDAKNNDKIAEAFSATAKAVETHVAKKEKYAANIMSVSQILEAQVTIDDTMDEEALNDALKKVNDGAEALLKDRNEQKAAKEKAEKEVVELKESIAKKNAEIDALGKKVKESAAAVKKLKKENKRLKDLLNPNGDNDGGNVAQANPALQYSKLTGKVTFVNPEFGFVMIDLGTKNKITVTDKTGKPVEQTIALPEDALMSVYSSLDPENAHFVARIQIVKVGENSAAANVIPGLMRQMPKKGDVVFFSSADIKQVIAKRAEALKAKMDAEARAKSSAEEDESADGDSTSEEPKSEENASSEESASTPEE